MNDSRPRDLTQEELALTMAASADAKQTAPSVSPPGTETATTAPPETSAPASGSSDTPSSQTSSGGSSPTLLPPEERSSGASPWQRLSSPLDITEAQ